MMDYRVFGEAREGRREVGNSKDVSQGEQIISLKIDLSPFLLPVPLFAISWLFTNDFLAYPQVKRVL